MDSAINRVYRFTANLDVEGKARPQEWEAAYSDCGLVALTLNPAKRSSQEPSTEKDKRFDRLKKLIDKRLAGKAVDLEWDAFDMRGRPPFFTKVWKAMHAIPFGEVATYSEIAEAAGSPMASRACGQACHNNPVILFIPCHRVVASSGLGGFGCGPHLKTALLALEGIRVAGDKLILPSAR